MKTTIDSLKNRVLSGGAITKEEARELLAIPLTDCETIDYLIEASHEITEKFSSKEAELCSLINAKSGACEEDCKFCGQSSHYSTNVETYPLLDEEVVLERAKEVEKMGAQKYCLVTAQRELKEKSFEKILNTFESLSKKTNLGLDASIGLLTDEKARRLKQAGVTMVNHNLEASENYFKDICSTHEYEDRKNTVRYVKKHGMQACSGGILGMGESQGDRVDLAFTLKELDVDIVPLNIMNPRPGTPLENVEKIEPLEVIKTVSVFRFILPKPVLKLSGGREVNLGDEWQPIALRAGANGLIIGGYLTTGGGEPVKDLKMLEKAGYSLPKPVESKI